MFKAIGAKITVFLLCALAAGNASGADLYESLAGVSAIVSDAYVFLHENPELGKKEFKAQAYLQERLRALGITEFVPSSQAPTAVIAVLDSGRPGPVIALRSEMDARPLEPGTSEPAHHSPRSKTDGIMHNCGHDIHAAILLGTAAVLSRNRDKFAGKIVFLFQPAEETAGGADDIVREGILTKLGVERIFAQHVAPGMPVGTIAVAPGYALAGSSYFTLKIKGKGSHAATPFEGTDTPLVAARFALELAEFPARRLDIVNRPVVISVTRLVADGGASNVLPANAELSGTIRAFENIDAAPDGGHSLRELLSAAVERLAKATGIDYEWSMRAGAPPTLNNLSLFEKVTKPLAETWPGTLKTQAERGMFSEDFAYYTAVFPALYFALGIAKDGRGNASVHTADFDIHPDTFLNGLRLMTTLALIGTTGSARW